MFAMRDDDTKLMELTVDQWNAFTFYYFKEDGDARCTTHSPCSDS